MHTFNSSSSAPELAISTSTGSLVGGVSCTSLSSLTARASRGSGFGATRLLLVVCDESGGEDDAGSNGFAFPFVTVMIGVEDVSAILLPACTGVAFFTVLVLLALFAPGLPKYPISDFCFISDGFCGGGAMIKMVMQCVSSYKNRE